jgi:putative DNA primase/helicase
MTTQHDAPYTGPTTEDLNHLPAVLKARPQWVLWRGADRIDQQTGEVKLNKIPIAPQTLRPASVTDDETWGTFRQCVDALPLALEEWQYDDPTGYRGGGLGFVVTPEDPYCGVDLDTCRDPQTGAVAPWARKIITALASYTEISPSQTGIRIFVAGALPPTGRRKGPLEMYDHARFLTLTGWHLGGTPATIVARHDALLRLHQATFGGKRAVMAPGSAMPRVSPVLTDAAILDHARQARNSGKFLTLWDGCWGDAGYASQSEADCALCTLLAFWTQDPEQVARLFTQSGLYRADKWGERPDYQRRTIAAALTRQTDHFGNDHEITQPNHRMRRTLRQRIATTLPRRLR